MLVVPVATVISEVQYHNGTYAPIILFKIQLKWLAYNVEGRELK
jgi:hypothetical protein